MLMNIRVRKAVSKQLIVLTLIMCLLPHSNLVLALEGGQKPNYQSSEPCAFHDDLIFNSPEHMCPEHLKSNSLDSSVRIISLQTFEIECMNERPISSLPSISESVPRAIFMASD